MRSISVIDSASLTLQLLFHSSMADGTLGHIRRSRYIPYRPGSITMLATLSLSLFLTLVGRPYRLTYHTSSHVNVKWDDSKDTIGGGHFLTVGP